MNSYYHTACFLLVHFTAKTIGSLFFNPAQLTCCFLSFMTVHSHKLSNSSSSFRILTLQLHTLLKHSPERRSFRPSNPGEILLDIICGVKPLCSAELILFFPHSCFKHRCNWTNKNLPARDSMPLKLSFYQYKI